MTGRNAIACDLKSLGIRYYIVVVGIINIDEKTIIQEVVKQNGQRDGIDNSCQAEKAKARNVDSMLGKISLCQAS